MDASTAGLEKEEGQQTLSDLQRWALGLPEEWTWLWLHQEGLKCQMQQAEVRCQKRKEKVRCAEGQCLRSKLGGQNTNIEFRCNVCGTDVHGEGLLTPTKKIPFCLFPIGSFANSCDNLLQISHSLPFSMMQALWPALLVQSQLNLHASHLSADCLHNDHRNNNKKESQHNARSPSQRRWQWQTMLTQSTAVLLTSLSMTPLLTTITCPKERQKIISNNSLVHLLSTPVAVYVQNETHNHR